MEENFTSYEASSFAMDASKMHFDKRGLVVPEDFPAFVHEWWHYVQDVTTITGQNGFYLWLRDLVRMTSITCSQEGGVIYIPLQKDQYDEVFSKYRKLYNIFCGAKDDECIADAKITKDPIIEPNEISIDGEERKFAKCSVFINEKTKYFGLIALQELNAFYAQKIAENYLPSVEFTVKADSLPEFPYKVGDMLFNYFKIESDLRTRFIISTLVQDTLQAPAVFLCLLKELRGKTINYCKDRKEILKIFEQVAKKYSYPNEAAYEEWGKDYSNWLNDSSHMMLRDSLAWYISIIGLAERLKRKHGYDTLPVAFSQGHQFLQIVYSCFPVPLIKIGEEILSQDIGGNDPLSIAAKRDYENALVIWSHRRIYDLLKSTNHEEAQKNATCPLYNGGKCEYIKNYKENKTYDCKTAPWMVVKGEKQALCPYAIAAHSMGLWQNELEIHL